MNYERLYSFRFRDIDQDGRIAVWQQISPHVHGLMGSPQKVLDPAAGRGEFIGAIPAKETWAVDAVSYDEAAHKPDTKVITAMIMDAELPADHFDGVFVSNFLEHLDHQEAIAAFLEKMNSSMEGGGRIAIMGPNYRYCSDEYWDCADHYVALTHVAIEEHLYAAGFEIERVIPRYLPYSFRGILPPSPALTRLYLKTPLAWRLLGKQFLVIGRKVPRILVIGCGFIGSNIVEELVAAGRPPAVLTRSAPVGDVAAKIGTGDLVIGDATDPETVERALEGVDHVIFSAGGLLPAASEQDPELDARLTLGPVRTVLERLRERPGVGLTYLSSGGTVYGEPEAIPVPEDAPTEAFGAYGRLHLQCESEVLAASREHGLPARILRCATVYGEHQHPDRGQGAVVTFLHRIERGEQIDLYGGGASIRDYVYVGDVARAAIALVEAGGPAVINVGSGEGTSLIELLRLVEAQLGREAQVVQHEPRDFEVHQIVLDTTLLHQTVELETTGLAAGIARTHRWLVTGRPERV